MQAGPSRSVEPESAVPARRVWTDREDTVLREAVRLYGSRTGPGSAWPAISQHVGGGRTNKDCRKRWFHTLDPTLKKGRWTADEDETLRRGYADIGPQWRKLAMLVPGRTDEQVAKRWKDVLSPDLNLDAQWTPEEDALLVKLFKEHGPKWTLMSDSFPTRNGIACRNRFRRFRRTDDTTESVDLSPGDFLPLDESDMSFFDSVLEAGLAEAGVVDHGEPSHHGEPSQHGEYSQHSQHDQSTLPSQSGQSLPWTPSWTPNGFTFPDFAPEPSQPIHTPVASGSTPAWLHEGQFSDWLASQPWSDRVEREQAAKPGSPIENVWGLLVALESGRESMTLSASLVRQLLADASKK